MYPDFGRVLVPGSSKDLFLTEVRMVRDGLGLKNGVVVSGGVGNDSYLPKDNHLCLANHYKSKMDVWPKKDPSNMIEGN